MGAHEDTGAVRTVTDATSSMFHSDCGLQGQLYDVMLCLPVNGCHAGNPTTSTAMGGLKAKALFCRLLLECCYWVPAHAIPTPPVLPGLRVHRSHAPQLVRLVPPAGNGEKDRTQNHTEEA